MTLDSARAVAIRNDLTVVFRTAALAAQPYYPNVCSMGTSRGASEDVGLPGAVPAIREWAGDRQENTLRAARFNLEHGLYEGTVRIPRADWEDDRLGLHRLQVEQLGQRAALHPDKLLVDLIEAGAATVCWDGQYFYDTDHAWGTSGTQSNDLTYNCSDHTAPTIIEMRAAIRAAVDAIVGFKDDQGEPLYQPTVNRLAGVEITVPIALRDVAVEAATAALVNSGESNVVLDSYQVRTIPRFTSGVKFWVHLTSDVIRPFVFFERTPIREEISGLDSIKEKDILFMTEARYSLGYLAWWLSVQTELN